MLSKLILAAIGLLALPSWATLTINDVRNASAFNISTGTSPVIYGGVAGTCATTNNSTTCNSCDGLSALTACNRTRIYGSLELELVFTFDDANKSGVAKLFNTDKATMLVAGSSAVSSGQQSSISITWNTLCTTVGGAADCDEVIPTKTIYLVIDVNGNGAVNTDEPQVGVAFQVQKPDESTHSTIDDCDASPEPTEGVCDFKVYPGDGKVYIEDSGFASGFPNSSGGGTFKKLRFFFSTTDFDTVAPGLETFKDVGIEADGTEFKLSEDRIDDLENGTQYFFRVATVDEAENISNITSTLAVSTICNGGTAPENDPDCPLQATPDKVLGLLTEDINCFIATAAFGSSWTQELQTFRKFRNRVLLPTAWGKKFINAYYNYGARASLWIVDNPVLKFLARLSLYPMWVFAWLSLKIGLAWTTLLSAFALSLMSLPLIFRKRLLRAP